MPKKKAKKRKKPKSRKLTPKQESFCQEYMLDFNATQAAIRAGYSKKTAHSQGQRLLKNVEAKQKIKEMQDKLAEQSGVTNLMLMEEWKKIGFANIKDFIGFDNKIKSIKQLPAHVAAAISSITYTKQGIKLTFHSKETALENMGKHIGFYRENNKQLGDAFSNMMERIDGKTKGLPDTSEVPR